MSGKIFRLFKKTPRWFPVFLIFSTGVGLSVTAAAMIYKWEQVQTRERFIQSSDRLTFAMQRNLDSISQVARSLAGLYNASEEVTPEEFTAFSEQVLRDAPSVLGLGYIEPVTHENRVEFEEKWLNSARIWTRNQQGQSTPASQVPEYFPNTYLEPAETLEPLLGYDHGRDWQRKAAIAKAQNIGIITTTGVVDLETSNNNKQEHNKQGLFLYIPTAENITPKTTSTETTEITTNPPHLNPVAFVVFQVDDLVQIALKGLNFQHLDFYLYEMPIDQLSSAFVKNLDSPQDHLITYYNAQTENFTNNTSQQNYSTPNCPYSIEGSTCIHTLNIQDQEWSLVIIPTATFTGFPWVAGGTLGVGLLSTSFLVFYLWMSLQRTLQQEQLVTALTASEIKLKNQKIQLENTLAKLQQAQTTLIQTEKMSSLGQLVAGITHELNNPLSFIQGNLDYALTYSKELLDLLKEYQKYCPQVNEKIQQKVKEIELDYIEQDFPKLLQSMSVGASRIQSIVKSMKNFARHDEVDLKFVEIHQGIEDTLMLVTHKLQRTLNHPEIKVIRNYSKKFPKVECDIGKVNQVFLSLLENAIDAVAEKLTPNNSNFTPTIRIKTQLLDNKFISIEIEDNGVGIPATLGDKIYDPFVTHKPVGKGTGLGLAISYNIITEIHKGKIDYISTPEKGTTFWIKLPIFHPR